MYALQAGTIVADTESQTFRISQEKQGVPMSPQLLNGVLERIMKKLKERWSAGGWGLDLGEGGRLQNLHFADDVLIIGTALSEVQKMLEEMSIEAKAAGLNLHPDKTKCLSTVIERRDRYASKGVLVDGMTMEVLGIDQTTEYLGRRLGFTWVSGLP